jgi:hypothetical protein
MIPIASVIKTRIIEEEKSNQNSKECSNFSSSSAISATHPHPALQHKRTTAAT